MVFTESKLKLQDTPYMLKHDLIVFERRRARGILYASPSLVFSCQVNTVVYMSSWLWFRHDAFFMFLVLGL